MGRTIHVIINPAAGQAQPILNTLNNVFIDAGVTWDVSLTQKLGDGRQLAVEAVAAGADVVAAYGGDGTIADVAGGLIGTGVPLALLPGGTANVLSVELDIPQALDAAARVASQSTTMRAVDVGDIGDRRFVLRLGIGFEAAMVKMADRQLKDRLGALAYALAAIQALREPQVAQYTLTLDDQEIQCEGLTCVITNSGNLGTPGLTFAPNILIDDGLLDVIVVQRANLAALLSVLSNVAGLEEDIDVPGNANETEEAKPLQHWQAHSITVRAEPEQTVQADGEIIHPTPVHVQVLPGALNVLVPDAARTSS